jgi:hypothetical protein
VLCEEDFPDYQKPPISGQRCPKCAAPIKSFERIIAPVALRNAPVPFKKEAMLDMLQEPDDMDLEYWDDDEEYEDGAVYTEDDDIDEKGTG